jgi:hypothetical protein
MSQTPSDILSKHINNGEHFFTGTPEFEYMTKTKSMIQDCDKEYLMSFGVDTCYLNHFKIIDYLAIFHSNKYNFQEELDLSNYIEINRYQQNSVSTVVYQQIRLNKFEEIISLSSKTNSVQYTLIYIKGIIK